MKNGKTNGVRLLCLLGLSLMMTLPARGASPRLVDNAGYLTRTQAADLRDTLDAISARQGMDVVIVTVSTLGGKGVNAFADDFYDTKGYAADGILLLIADREREWSVSATGFGETAFTDAGLAYMEERFLPALSDGDYALAFETFAELCDEFFIQAKTGAPYDRGNLPRGDFFTLTRAAIFLCVGLAVAWLIVWRMKRALKSVAPQAAASRYAAPGSLHVTGGGETFLYRHVSRVKREKSDSSGSSGGGFSRRVSSSGRSHSGRSGRF